MFQTRVKKKVFHDDCKVITESFRERLILHLKNRGYDIVECYPKGDGDFLIIKDSKTDNYKQKVVTEKDVIKTIRLFGLRY